MKNLQNLKTRAKGLLIELRENDQLIRNELLEYIETEGKEGILAEAIGRLPLKDLEKIAKIIENILVGN